MDIEKIITLFVGIATGINLLTGSAKNMQDIKNNKKKKRRSPSKRNRRN